ncbi:MAG: hypothetical protein M3O09_04500 [Acidobacteriota bacterium]|nr:hypothetical protein [Acidobacteriota bacterium]
MNRRKFLESLGLTAAAAIALPKVPYAGTWLFPEAVIEHVGTVTPEWIGAEALALLMEMYPGTLTRKTGEFKLSKGMEQLGISIPVAGTVDIREMPLARVREQYIRPAMAQFANKLKESKPKYCFPLVLPGGLDWTSRAVNNDRGMDLRFLRAYDIMENKTINRFDICVG